MSKIVLYCHRKHPFTGLLLIFINSCHYLYSHTYIWYCTGKSYILLQCNTGW